MGAAGLVFKSARATSPFFVSFVAVGQPSRGEACPRRQRFFWGGALATCVSHCSSYFGGPPLLSPDTEREGKSREARIGKAIHTQGLLTAWDC